MKAVIYARYSSDNQTEASIEGQLRECMEFSERTEIDVIGNYIDRALTAKTDNRPEFQRMIKDSYKHAFDCIIVWKLDCFARNRYDSAHYKSLLKKNGVKVISAKESIGEGSEGILLESVLEEMGNFQCSIIIYAFYYICFFVLSNIFPCFRKAFCVFCKFCRGKRLYPSPLFVAIYSSFSSGSGI